MHDQPLPPPSRELSRRLMRVDIAYTVSRMRVIEARPGNPLGVEVRHFDGVVALMARRLPSMNFNRVVGLKAGDEPLIEPLARWYRDNAVAVRFELAPGDHSPELGRALAEHGYFQSGFQVSLYGAPRSEKVSVPDIAVQPVHTEAAMDRFLEAYIAGWKLTEPVHANVQNDFRPWRHQQGWHLFVGLADGQAAAAAILYLHDGIGYFADATTNPKFRGRGLQAALLRARSAFAHANAAELVFGQAEFGSASHRNMERVGLRALHTRALWTQLEPNGAAR